MGALLLILLGGCSSTMPEPVCDPGHVAACPCEIGEEGTRECLASGEGYGDCLFQPMLPRSTADREPGAEDDGEESEAASEPTGEPTVFTRISFDLRGMPHRGPRDVDPAMITSRVELLMQRARDAAGEPAPRLTYQPGVSVFRAEFYGSEADAGVQCERVVAEVAPEVDPTSRRAAFREPHATPCALMEADE